MFMKTVNYTVKQLGVVNQVFPLMIFGLAKLPLEVYIPMSAIPKNYRGASLFGKYIVYEFSIVPHDDNDRRCVVGHFYNFLN